MNVVKGSSRDVCGVCLLWAKRPCPSRPPLSDDLVVQMTTGFPQDCIRTLRPRRPSAFRVSYVIALISSDKCHIRRRSRSARSLVVLVMDQGEQPGSLTARLDFTARASFICCLADVPGAENHMVDLSGDSNAVSFARRDCRSARCDRQPD